MSKQQQMFGGGDTPEPQNEEGSHAQAQVEVTGTDDLLDEIDALLDTNAEEFVRSFVQKGGQ
ncbi:ubiquitin-like protein Pup [Corynebacterium pseudogenitalium]|uniref:ubiquitin-like protein Pup n=1 Tax=Corynebacterium pseudogenitalium TaxID=38303 RepID=UPI003BA1C78B